MHVFFIGREEKLKIMNTHSGGGSADKNEKTTLLREITYLTRLIQQHDYKNKAASRLDVSVRTQTPKNKCLNIHQLNPSGASYGGSIQINRLNYSNVQTSSCHGAQQMSLPASHSVFVNPKKLNCQLLEANHAAERIQKQNNIAAVDIEYMPHRVYINPNFKKKVSPTNKPVFKFVAGHVTSPSILGTVNKKIYINREANFGSKNIVHQYVESVLPANSINKNPDGYRIRKSQKAVSNVNPEQLNKTMSYKKHSLSNSCLTHICRDNQVNIVDQKPQNLARKVMFHNTEPKVVQKSENTDMSQTSDGSISLCRHPVEFESRTITSTEKIPFQKHEPPKTDSVTPEHYTSVYSLQESSKHSELVLGKETVSKICNPKSNGNNIKKSSGLCASIQPQKIRDMNCHRRRSSSTCLVAVSKTKLVRKRKLDINGMDTESNKGIPVQKKKLMKLLQPANRYKLNKIGTVTIKNITPNAYSVNNNPFRLVKLKPGIKVLPGKANSHNGDRFKLVRLKTSANSSSSNKFKLVLAQKNVKQAHCPVENVTLVQSKLPGKSIKSKRVIKKGLESAVDIQGKKGIQLTKDARNKWFSAGNTAMLLTKKTKLPRANKFKNEINNKMKRTPPGSELMAVSRTKLVRKPVSEITRIQKLKTAEYRNEIKLTHSVKLAHRVKNKYKFIRNQLNTINTVQHVNPRCQVLQNTLRMQSMLKKRIASRILKKRCSLIKIGDAYYRASYNKLTRRTPVRATGHCDSVKVQGKKFILQRGRQSLKYFRVTPLRLSKLKNGSCNVRPKIGTPNTPFSRLIQAKQRSIALLTNRLRKNNQPCLMFNRFGRCAGKDKGTCNKLHDPKNIAICKRFVQGCCENPSCLLSHNVGPEKMPTCHHFLAGNCVRENCPYLHVKLSKKAPICIAFLQGYCADAANCQKRHEHTCPEFEEKGVCPKGKYCPYPHPKEKINHCRSSEQCKTSIETCMKNNVEEYEEKTKNAYEEETKNVVSSCRYFEEATAGEFPSAECIEESMFEEGAVCINDESSNCWINKRPKIGNLPGYIPLMNNSVEKIT